MFGFRSRASAAEKIRRLRRVVTQVLAKVDPSPQDFSGGEVALPLGRVDSSWSSYRRYLPAPTIRRSQPCRRSEPQRSKPEPAKAAVHSGAAQHQVVPAVAEEHVVAAEAVDVVVAAKSTGEVVGAARAADGILP